jgi:hypothetical protein
MINPINTSASASYVVQALEPQKSSDTNTKTQKTSLPVIATLGNQARAVGDSANPACVPCWTVCLAGPQAPICAALCIAMCIPPFSA